MVTTVYPYFDRYHIDMTIELFSETRNVQIPLNIHNPCVDVDQNWINIPEIALNSIQYELRSPELSIFNLASNFQVENEFCGDLNITIDF